MIKPQRSSWSPSSIQWVLFPPTIQFWFVPILVSAYETVCTVRPIDRVPRTLKVSLQFPPPILRPPAAGLKFGFSIPMRLNKRRRLWISARFLSFYILISLLCRYVWWFSSATYRVLLRTYQDTRNVTLVHSSNGWCYMKKIVNMHVQINLAYEDQQHETPSYSTDTAPASSLWSSRTCWNANHSLFSIRTLSSPNICNYRTSTLTLPTHGSRLMSLAIFRGRALGGSVMLIGNSNNSAVN